jgi:hypothetical protein
MLGVHVVWQLRVNNVDGAAERKPDTWMTHKDDY